MTIFQITTALAALLAGALALLDLSGSRYFHTTFCIRKCPGFYLYGVLYAALAATVMIAYEALLPHEGPHSPLGSNLWVRMFIVAFFLRTFLRSPLLTIPSSSGAAPNIVSLDKVIVFFEPHLLQWIDDHHENRLVGFLDERTSGKTLDEIKEIVKKNLPTTLAGKDKAAFLTDIEQAADERSAATLYLRRAGHARFKRAFPVQQVATKQSVLFIPSKSSLARSIIWPIIFAILSLVFALAAFFSGVGAGTKPKIP